MEEYVRELALYSETISKEEIANLFDHLTKRSIPLLGFLDTSFFFCKIPSPIIVHRDSNTIHFYMKETKSIMQLANLMFPFKVGESKKIERRKGNFLQMPQIYIMSGENFLNFLIKEDIVELSFNVRKIFGKLIGTVVAVDSRKNMHAALVTNPESFFQIDLEKHPTVYIEVLEPMPKSISMSNQCPLFEGTDTRIGIDNFDPIQHSLMVGESGSGKTKFLYTMIRALEKKYVDGIRILVVDPHGEFAKLMPHHKIVDFKGSYIEPLDVGGEKSPLMTQLISQLMSTAIGEENKYSERVLFYATYLLSSVDRLTLGDMSKLLTDPAVRMELTTKSDVDEARRFFDQEYQDIYIHHFNNAVLPILNFIGEYELYLGKAKQNESLHDLVENNRVTLVSFDPNFFGKRMIKFLSGAIINQMYILAITGKIKRPTILIVDEFPRVETLVVKDLLAETRKFNLYAYLSMQYLGQLRKEILDAIVSNTRNIVSFKTNRVDATLVSSIMEIKLEEYFKKNRSTTELEESKKEMFVRLNQRECIVRLFDGKRYMLPMKLRSVDMAKWMDGGEYAAGMPKSGAYVPNIAPRHNAAMFEEAKKQVPENMAGGFADSQYGGGKASGQAGGGKASGQAGGGNAAGQAGGGNAAGQAGRGASGNEAFFSHKDSVEGGMNHGQAATKEAESEKEAERRLMLSEEEANPSQADGENEAAEIGGLADRGGMPARKAGKPAPKLKKKKR